MNTSMISGSLICALFLSGANAAHASEPPADAQNQARLLLTGNAAPQANRSVARFSGAPGTAALDAHAQAIQMILGQPRTRTPAIRMAGTAGQPASSSCRPNLSTNLARQMIIGSEPGQNLNCLGTALR